MRSYFRKILHQSLYNSAHSRAFYTLAGIFLHEIKYSFKQFYTFKYPIRSLFNVIGIILSSFFRLILGRSLKYSFAFYGEDRIIEGILKPLIDKPGTYVDVGCNHPKFLSNTYGLYKKGWKGVCIDANQDLIKLYGLFRPKDIALAAVVSDKPSYKAFYKIENDVLSTVEAQNLDKAVESGLSYEVINYKSVTLTSVLSKYSIERNFDLLSIDAEEHDFEVLSSLDFDLFSPKLIMVEDESFKFKGYTDNRFVQFLETKNYHMIGFVLTNAYFVKQDHPIR